MFANDKLSLHSTVTSNFRRTRTIVWKNEEYIFSEPGSSQEPSSIKFFDRLYQIK